jgi:guanine nucleotide-binding protein subunit alpha
VIDLASYDRVQDSRNELMETLDLFNSIADSGWFIRAGVILVLSRVWELKRKLRRSPMNKHFPDYSGGNNVHHAAKYILRKFTEVKQAKFSIYPYLTDRGAGPAFLKFISSAIMDCLIARNMRGLTL